MIKKRTNATGVNTNIALEPTAASSSTSNINNNIIINKREGGDSDNKRCEYRTRRNNQRNSHKNVILETYAQILLNQDKALLSNLIFKHTIIVSKECLEEIIKAILKVTEVEVYLDEDINCCAGKANPIRKIEAIKIIKENGEIVTDFKQVYNKEFNELVNNYLKCIKFCV
ncbi:hypothetical protein M9Y10_010216 [Tritrichomonas musculus]|uniref:Uncharacterized protein n=1 Tax=Tritrichomonas musculus TaxID=1915356 RepID=A0ABR2IQM2_9EUKA